VKAIWWGVAAAGGAGAAAVWKGLRKAAVRAGDRALPAAVHRGGSGTPLLLLLHGVGGSWTAWKPVLPLLESHHDVLAPSLLGHGGATLLGPGVAPTLDALVDGVEAELDRAGIETAHVVGNSLGGWIAIELARRGRARSVVLFSPAGAWSSQRRIEAVALGIRPTISLLARAAPYADVIAPNRLLRNVLMGLQVARPDLIDPQALADDIRGSAHAPAVVPLLRLLPTLTLEPLPAERTYPVRVVWGEQDRVIPYLHFGVPMLATLSGAELIHQPGLGHVPMSDDPETVARLITEVTTAVDRHGYAETLRRDQ
jgi:pimeloyl-ACP methyl ester carboxylesterase